jgi:hypothetical protein
MSNPRRVIVGLLLMSATATGARAQALQHVEVGAGVGAAVSWWGSPVGGGDARVTVPLNERFAVEGLIAFLATRGDWTAGIYGIQVKQRLRRSERPASHAFVSYGLVGGFARYHENEYRYTQPNGSLVIVPAHTDTYVSPPFIGFIGGGVQHAVARRLAVRVEAQAVMPLFVPVGVRVAAGVSVPLGDVK